MCSHRSPFNILALLVADFSAQAVVNTFLAEQFPADPIVGEEDTKDLRRDEGKALRKKVLELTNEVLAPEGKELTEDKVRGHGGGRLSVILNIVFGKVMLTL